MLKLQSKDKHQEITDKLQEITTKSTTTTLVIDNLFLNKTSQALLEKIGLIV